MIPFRELRAVTGKLSWVAGTIPRMRWVVSIMYAVVASVDKDAKSGVEVQRAKRRQDTRSKSLACSAQTPGAPTAMAVDIS